MRTKLLILRRDQPLHTQLAPADPAQFTYVPGRQRLPLRQPLQDILVSD